ncbi:hypothetical protein C8R46DRAFT_1297715 [Mycena filopes]|nr:hypothetical protein C8R46DRAFT_1297715 [Mycena filopes]
MGSILSQAFPHKSKFAVDDIPDLSGKVIIVTGGNSGVGKETAKALLQHNAKVYIAARSPGKTKQAIAELKAETGREAEYLPVDLADLQSIKRGVAEFTRKEHQLHVLFNNGGVMGTPVEQLTAQNYDLQFGTNVLGHFYLTKLLLPTLIATASAGAPARVVNTSSSGAELWSGPINFASLKGNGPAKKKLTTEQLYYQSKLGNVAFSNELFRRYGDQGIMSVALNPGNLKSGLQRHMSGIKLFILNLMLYPTPKGALTQLWAGTTDVGATFGGKYLFPWARMGTSPSKDVAMERELWTWMEEQVEGI